MFAAQPFYGKNSGLISPGVSRLIVPDSDRSRRPDCCFIPNLLVNNAPRFNQEYPMSLLVPMAAAKTEGAVNLGQTGTGRGCADLVPFEIIDILYQKPTLLFIGAPGIDPFRQAALVSAARPKHPQNENPVCKGTLHGHGYILNWL